MNVNLIFDLPYHLDQPQHGNAVREAAERGSLIAQKIIQIWELMDSAEAAFNGNDQCTLITSLSKAIRLDFQFVQIPDKYKLLIKHMIDEALNNFPGDEYFLDLKIGRFVLSVPNRNVEALATANQALQLYPTSLRFLYWKAIASCLQEDDSGCIEALDAFLAVAPNDHNYVPSCHYRKALHYGSRVNDALFVQAFETAVESEQYQLSCFLPYQFPDKEFIRMCYNIAKRRFESDESSN
uniref:Tetratricopeptide repeat protein n=1 Tax=Panagrolaimus sp. PS1159 TaxID=55785 RepID=A0AC35GBG8_9BILA